MTYAQLYDMAIDLLEIRGWQQGPDYEDDHGRLCVVGAIRAAGELWSWDDDMIDDAVRWLSRYLFEHVDPDAWDDVFEWNDDPNTTHEDVVLMLKHLSEFYGLIGL